MAKMVPARHSCLPRMTAGEKRLSERLEQKLEDDYLCWYNVPVGPKQLHPDFIIVHPQRGFLVLEVKDWKLETLVSGQVDRHSFQIYTDRGIVTEKNPQMQARVYALEVAVALERDPALRNPPGHRYSGKLVMPYGWGAVLTNITRAQLQASGLEEVLESGRVICRDEMLESVTPEAFQARLWEMFSHPFPCKLTLPQLDRIRWHLFPEVRINADANQFGLFKDIRTSKPKDKPYKLPKEAGLCLIVNPSGAKYWRFTYSFAGKEKTISLGVYPQVPLTLARQRREAARRLVAEGVDPSAHRQAERAAREVAAIDTFAAMVERWDADEMAVNSEEYRTTVRRMLDRDVLPYIGERPLLEIRTRELVVVFDRIRQRGVEETARRARTIVGQVFRYANVACSAGDSGILRYVKRAASPSGESSSTRQRSRSKISQASIAFW